ncbi:MAG: TIM-barrel domain-containing protein [Candidatus Acidiferrales bacterium]
MAAIVANSVNKVSGHFSRRKAIALLGAAGAGALANPKSILAGLQSESAAGNLALAGQPVELTLIPATERTLRISFIAISPQGQTQPIEKSLDLVRDDWPAPLARLRAVPSNRTIPWGRLRVQLRGDPLSLFVEDAVGKTIQRLQFDRDTASVGFDAGNAPLLGLGEGGRQFDRRGDDDSMKNGQYLPDLRVTGARMPIPWLIGAGGWALFFHRPYGAFDLTRDACRFSALDPSASLPLDIFLVAAHDPSELLREYAQLTGFPHMPPMWALGYHQSHRTLESNDEVVSEAAKFRSDALPCDNLIYLGTGYAPSGWNTGPGSFAFNDKIFPHPEETIRQLHDESFKVILHVNAAPKDLHGAVSDEGAAAADPADAAHYWAQHLAVFRAGVDGWWPDDGDELSPESRLARNRMYWDGPQLERPSCRPFTLHRNGYAGSQRYGWLWSGDTTSRWETLAAQVGVGINTGLSGMPYWGTDTGGFFTTPEYTGELYVRWFQFSCFCPLFRSHGRAWKLHTPWGWNTGDYGPKELTGNRPGEGLPDPSELHNAAVEPICRKYLELRYRLLPYTYTAVREAHDTGLPVMRALWLHYPHDPNTIARGDEYLWGRDIVVAPVTEKGATARKLYLPAGFWYDFWTGEQIAGGREIDRAVDLATIPLYVRAGAIIPMGPVKQFALQQSDAPMRVDIYPGGDGEYRLYEDDGGSFDYENGHFTRTRFLWNNHSRECTIALEPGSTLISSPAHEIELRVVPQEETRRITFSGKTIAVRL